MTTTAPHRCDEVCVCPVHSTQLIYSPATNDHACQETDCEHGHGGLDGSALALHNLGTAARSAAVTMADLNNAEYDCDPQPLATARSTTAS
ncbi:hypothetical protein [Kitasatospora sp. NPDC087315]|uniref:hypothetical protein n=1 Tax=Kitasatospora sp. NPDC087315 TaxID=3364069 RepID=UPI003807FC2B